MAKSSEPVSKKSGGMMSKRTLLVLLVLALIVGLGYTGSRYMDAKKEINRLSDPQAAAQEANAALIAEVGLVTELPANESPTIATVSDVEKLKEQPFFANAQNGDKVLIYPEAKKAYMYRPSTKKIVEIAPINIGEDSSAKTN